MKNVFQRISTMVSVIAIGLIGLPQLVTATAAYNADDAQFTVAMLIFLGAIGVTIVVIGFLWTIFWVWMLVDAIQNAPDDKRLLWVLLLVFFHYFAAIVYYFMEYRPRQQKNKTAALSTTDKAVS